jgi:hypothetical protein
MEKKRIIATHKIEDFVEASKKDRVKISDLIDSMEGSGFGLTMMIFSFGLIIPLPPPVPSLISIPLLIFAFQMMVGYNAPKLPRSLSNITIKRSILATLVRKSFPYIAKIEKILRPRLLFMMGIVAERVLGALIFIFAGFVMIPVPFSNFIPGLAILIISFGLLGRDGVVIIIGVLVGFIGVLISVLVLLMGLEVFSVIKEWFFI